MPKLVRDLIPSIILKQGRTPVTKILNLEEYKNELALKLIEEANEFNKDKNIEELADILEVYDTILKAYGFTPQELETARNKKKVERGGFDERIFLEEIK